MEAILTGARIQEIRLEALANNIANINTAGFKEDKIFSIEEIEISGDNDSAESTGSYLTENSTLELPVGTYVNFSQGPMIQTGNTLDLAIVGEGFFCVMTPDGKQYTRDGKFTINNDDVIVNQEGYPVLGTGGEISIDGNNFSADEISIDEEGNIYQGESEIDTLRIESFDDLGSLKKVGETLFATNNDGVSGDIAEEVSIRQGFLEQSNVETIRAMTEMIEVLRGYEAYQKALKTIDQIDSKAINEVGSIT